MFISSGPIGTSVLLLCVLLNARSGALDPDREMCYSRQHRDVTVNAHVALEQKGTFMVARAKPSEKDCILTCCSEDVSPGVKCNLVVYEPTERPADLNCQLFHCPSERDCPLMTASAGINTYNIFKGLTHPTTKGSGRITAKPAAPHLTTTTTTTTTTTPATTPTTAPAKTTTTTTPAPTTTTTTTTLPTTITITSTSISISTEASEEALTGSDPPVMLRTVAMTTASATTVASTTQSTSTATKVTITKAPHPPQRMPIRPARPKKPSRPSRPETHSAKPIRATMEPAATATTISSTTSAASTTNKASTTSTASTTSAASTTTPATEKSTEALIELDGDPEHHSFSRDRPILSLPEKPKVSRVMWKNSLVAIVVITLIFLALILSLVARKAMESFDRRHYTRLELNDLHYEV